MDYDPLGNTNRRNSNSVDLDGLLLDEFNYDILFLAKGKDGVLAMDITDKSAPVLIGRIILPGDCDDIVRLDEEILVAGCGSEGIHLVNVSDRTNLWLISSAPSIKGSVEGVTLSKDKNYAFASCRDQGMTVYNIKNRQNIFPVMMLYTYGGEGIITSKVHDNIVYMADGYKGLSIIDISNPEEPVLISQVALFGWAMKVTVSGDERYAFLAQVVVNHLVIIDISDIYNPKIQQGYDILNQVAYAVQVMPDMSYLFLQTDQGTQVIPLKSTISLIIECYEVGSTIQLDNKEPFYVGQKLVVQQDIGDLIIVFEYRIAVQTQDLISQEHGINQTMAEILLTQLIQKDIISPERFPEKTVDSYNVIDLSDDNLVQYQEYLGQVLRSKIDFRPVKLTIKPSLKFDPGSSTQQYIQTLSSDVMIELKIDINQGQWVKKNFIGVLATYSDSQDIINLKGPLNTINKQLNLITLANLTAISDISVEVFIDDVLNPHISELYAASQIQFLNLNDVVRLNGNIQEQFDRKFPNSEVEVLVLFEFQFDINTFIDSDPLTYTAKIRQESGSFEPLQTTHWLKFEQRGVSGIPPREMYGEKLYVQIMASDQYTETYAEFQIYANKIPITVILEEISGYISLLATIIGLFLFKGQLFNKLCRKKYVYDSDKVQIGKKYFRTITMIRKERIECNKIYNFTQNYIKKHKIKFKKLYIQNYEVDEEKYMELVIELNKTQKWVDDIKQFSEENGTYRKILVQKVYYEIFRSDQKLLRIYRLLKKFARDLDKNRYKDWYKFYIKVTHKPAQERYDIFPSLKIKEKTLMKYTEKAFQLITDHPQKPLPPATFYCDIDTLRAKFIQKYRSVKYNVLEKIIEGAALGINPVRGLDTFISYAKGESLIEQQKYLEMVAWFQKRHYAYCFERFIHLDDYEIMAMSGNQELPKWLEFNMIHGVIHLEGEPGIEDEGQYLIRVINTSGLYVMEFNIEVRDKVFEEEDDPDIEKEKIGTEMIRSVNKKLTQMQSEYEAQERQAKSQTIDIDMNITGQDKIKEQDEDQEDEDDEDDQQSDEEESNDNQEESQRSIEISINNQNSSQRSMNNGHQNGENNGLYNGEAINSSEKLQ